MPLPLRPLCVGVLLLSSAVCVHCVCVWCVSAAAANGRQTRQVLTYFVAGEDGEDRRQATATAATWMKRKWMKCGSKLEARSKPANMANKKRNKKNIYIYIFAKIKLKGKKGEQDPESHVCVSVCEVVIIIMPVATNIISCSPS